MYRFVSLAALLGACGDGPPTYITTHGMAVYVDSDRIGGKDWAVLDSALDAAVDELATLGVDPHTMIEAIGGSELHLYAGSVKCGGEARVTCGGGRRAGCYAGGGEMRSCGWTDCPTEWMLHYELVHMVQDIRGDDFNEDPAAMFDGPNSWMRHLYWAMRAVEPACGN